MGGEAVGPVYQGKLCGPKRDAVLGRVDGVG